jgi:hypothetical protein
MINLTNNPTSHYNDFGGFSFTANWPVVAFVVILICGFAIYKILRKKN